MAYIIVLMVIILLFMDNPFFKQLSISSKIKWLKWLILGLVSLHVFIVTLESYAKVISGIFLMGMVLIYSSASKHKGIEDRVARLVFKKMAWILLWLLLLLHVLY